MEKALFVKGRHLWKRGCRKVMFRLAMRLKSRRKTGIDKDRSVRKTKPRGDVSHTIKTSKKASPKNSQQKRD